MSRPTEAKLFLDGGDPVETERATKLLRKKGFDGLDGQTTNPSLVAKNPNIQARIASGERLGLEELLQDYQAIVQGIELTAPGDISIEVYADKETSAGTMIAQAREFARWSSSAVIKLPITEAGLKAAEVLKDEVRLNLTLCFTQQQAAAVYCATQKSRYPVFVSPFIGRLDDRGLNGMDLIANLMQMFKNSDGHVEVLTASARHIDHVLGALQLGTHAVTMPFEKAFVPWAETGFTVPDQTYTYPVVGQSIPFESLELGSKWTTFDIQHDLTDAGLQQFADDWNSLLKEPTQEVRL